MNSNCNLFQLQKSLFLIAKTVKLEFRLGSLE